MISDTLFEAQVEIEDYLSECREVYEEYAAEIHGLLAQMITLRRKLDDPLSAIEREKAIAAEAHKLSDPNYVPTAANALQHPQGFVDGRSETDLS